MRTLILLILVAGFTYAAGSLDASFSGALITQIRATNFPAAPGTITHSAARPYESDAHAFDPDIAYTYDVDQRRYQGRGLRGGSFTLALNRTQADAVLRAWPEGGAVTVRYDPRHPSLSVLQPGLDGGDLFAVMFVLLFNMAAGFLWRALIAATIGFPRRGYSDGGVRAFTIGRRLHVRLDNFRPQLSGFITFVLALFLGAGVSVLRMGHAGGLGIGFMLNVWAVILAVTGAVTARQYWKQAQGFADLIIDPDQGIIEVPRIEKAMQRLTAPLADVTKVAMETIKRRGPRGSVSYIDEVSLHLRGGSAIIVARWGNAARASAFAAWLPDKL